MSGLCPKLFTVSRSQTPLGPVPGCGVHPLRSQNGGARATRCPPAVGKEGPQGVWPKGPSGPLGGKPVSHSLGECRGSRLNSVCARLRACKPEERVGLLHNCACFEKQQQDAWICSRS